MLSTFFCKFAERYEDHRLRVETPYFNQIRARSTEIIIFKRLSEVRCTISILRTNLFAELGFYFSTFFILIGSLRSCGRLNCKFQKTKLFCGRYCQFLSTPFRGTWSFCAPKRWTGDFAHVLKECRTRKGRRLVKRRS